MACKRSGVRIPLAPHLRRSRAYSDLGKLLLSACNSASCQSKSSVSRVNPRQVRRHSCAPGTQLCRSRRSQTAKLVAIRVIRRGSYPPSKFFCSSSASLVSVNLKDLQSRRDSCRIRARKVCQRIWQLHAPINRFCAISRCGDGSRQQAPGRPGRGRQLVDDLGRAPPDELQAGIGEHLLGHAGALEPRERWTHLKPGGTDFWRPGRLRAVKPAGELFSSAPAAFTMMRRYASDA